MIGSLKGNIQKLKTGSVIIDISGVGYYVNISLNTYYNLVEKDSAFLYIYAYIREDKFELYGFLTEEEKEIFKILISVSGVGPSLACAIMSGMSYNELISVIKNRDIDRLTKTPGIGKTKAEKILLDLKNKLKKISINDESEHINDPLLPEDAVDALITLGFDEKKARFSVKEFVVAHNTTDLQDIIKGALKILS
jgi:Holliday junction DNA helicase RuvA